MKKKIIYVTPKFYPSKGGIETHVFEIARRMVKKYDVWVYSCDKSKENVAIKEIDGIHIRRFHSIHPGDAYFFSPALYAALRKDTCDILHLHNFNAAPALLAYKAMKKRAKRIIFTPHSHPRGSTGFREVLHKVYDPLQKGMIQNCSSIICVSEYEKKGLLDKYPLAASKVKVIYNGITVQKIPKPFNKQGKIILYVGRLEKYKNVQEIIAALPHNPGWKLVIAGDGPYKKELERKIRQDGMESRVRFVGWIDDTSKWRWYATSDVVITLSTIEAFGIIILEGLAANKPVIIGTAGSFKELQNKYPKKVFTFQKKKGFFDEVRSKAEHQQPNTNEFTWDTIINKISKLYN